MSSFDSLKWKANTPGFAGTVFICMLLGVNGTAQARANPSGAAPPSNAFLPDAPSSSLAAAGSNASASSIVGVQVASPGETPKTQKHIGAGQVAPHLDPADKMILGVRSAFSPFAVLGWFTAAGYEQVRDSSPDYGSDRGAFGERLGAAVIRDTTEGVMSDGVMASLLHEDPRYYRLGPSRSLPVRLLYAVSRPVMTRTDRGTASPNFALVSGTLAGAALTNAYYPPENRGAGQTFHTFGASLGGEAVADIAREFFGGVAGLFHPQRQ
jgi:hypothetical protein